MTTEYQYDYKTFQAEWRKVLQQFMREWVCAEHGPKDFCNHFNFAMSKKYWEIRQKYTSLANSPIGIEARTIGYHIRNFKGEPPPGYEYAWKTFYSSDRLDNLDTVFLNYWIKPELIEEHEQQGYIPVGYLDTKHGIPRNSDGFYADGDAVLCVRPSYIGEHERERINKHNHDIVKHLPALAEVVPEGCPAPDDTAGLMRAAGITVDKHLEGYGKSFDRVDVTNSLEQSPESYIYEGEDPEIWVPIMENMEANIAKLEAEEEAKKEFERTKVEMLHEAVGFIMEHERHCHFNEHAEEDAEAFIEKYRKQLFELGYRRY